MRTLITSLSLIAVVVLAGCRGSLSDEPPIHLNLNMDFQERFEAQERNPYFIDNRAMRPPVPGTVARGLLREDAGFFFGRTGDGSYVAELPVALTQGFVDRGQERYNIYCSVCHGDAGDGNGIIMVGNGGQGYGYVPAPTYHTDRLRSIEDGYLYDVITNGIRSMPGYAQQIPVADRWAIVAYIRALQRSQFAEPDDLPGGVLSSTGAATSSSTD